MFFLKKQLVAQSYKISNQILRELTKLKVEIPVKTIDEPRFLIIGKISGKRWTGVITYRSENIRIISVRGSRKEEIDIYES